MANPLETTVSFAMMPKYQLLAATLARPLPSPTKDAAVTVPVTWRLLKIFMPVKSLLFLLISVFGFGGAAPGWMAIQPLQAVPEAKVLSDPSDVNSLMVVLPVTSASNRMPA